ncbi:MAG: hypothetical protein HYT88_06085 [Candidatus Omnitrophica bacterium]|nr:hypothetical protein [Candidatus Omnitrophota bacterium]
MPTTLPRVNVPFEPATYSILRQFSRTQHASLSQVVSRLVKYAIELSEDLALAEVAEERLGTFRRDDALSTEQILRWNKGRKNRKK